MTEVPKASLPIGAEVCFNQIKVRFSSCRKLCANCDKLWAGYQKIAAFAPEYDYSPEIPGNGFRSYLKILEKFAARVLLLTPVNATVDPKLVTISELLVQVLDISEWIRNNHGKEEGTDSREKDFDVFEKSISVDNELLVAFYGTHSNFWICESMRKVGRRFIKLSSYYSSPLSRKSRVLWDIESASLAMASYAQNASVPLIKKAWSANEKWFLKTFLPSVLHGFGPKLVKTVFVVANNEWVIRPADGKLFSDKMNPRSNSVRCRLLHEGRFGLSPDNALVLHIHGGGFVAMSPESHEIYTRNWAQKLAGVPILSVDYSLSPENKYPKALQDVLDVYLFLVSGDNRVVDTIGFHPKRIVVCGDSAGGMLTLTLAMVLNDIRALSEATVAMPMGLLAFYPAISFKSGTPSSKMLGTFDTILPTGVMLSVGEAYLRENPTISLGDVSAPGSGPRGGRADKYVVSEKPLRLWEEKAWYRKEGAKDILWELYEKAADPYISPIYYQHFESLLDVPLFVVASEFDPLLDDSIAIAHKWKGRVSLDIMKDLPHGFLNFRHSSEEANKATDLCLDRLQNALKG